MMIGEKTAKKLELPFQILAALDKEIMNREELAWQLGVSPQIVGRQVKLLREQFNVRIKASPFYGYEIENWGILDRTRLLAFVSRRNALRAKQAARTADAASPQAEI